MDEAMPIATAIPSDPLTLGGGLSIVVSSPGNVCGNAILVETGNEGVGGSTKTYTYLVSYTFP